MWCITCAPEGLSNVMQYQGRNPVCPRFPRARHQPGNENKKRLGTYVAAATSSDGASGSGDLSVKLEIPCPRKTVVGIDSKFRSGVAS